jgi:hypothetical protein
MMDPLLGGHQARVEALGTMGEQHWVLSTTRNGQCLWYGPYATQEAAQGRQHTLLAPWSVVVTGRIVAGMTVRAACPHEGVEHTTEWCGCTCPE